MARVGIRLSVRLRKLDVPLVRAAALDTEGDVSTLAHTAQRAWARTSGVVIPSASSSCSFNRALSICGIRLSYVAADAMEMFSILQQLMYNWDQGRTK